VSSHFPRSSQPELELPTNLPGYHETKDEESNLTTVLDSLIPFIRSNDSSVKLLVFIGNLETVSETELGDYSGKSTDVREAGKEFAWSRGLGIEHSPVKTRSARKKASIENVGEPSLRSSTDGGALRDLKALARSK
jgi:hypothetical protein